MCLQDTRDDVPELVMLFLDQHNDTSRLRVESARHILDGLLNNLLELAVVDGALLGEGVNGTTVRNRVLEADRLVTHLCCRGAESAL